MDLHLTNKVALVTGASRGLGFATALGLAKEGCKVAINARNPQQLADAVKEIEAQAGQVVLGIAADVAEVGAPDRIIAEVIQKFGALDILVTNAGGPPPGNFESVSEEDWYKSIELSLMSQIRLIKSALPYLKQSQAASVLTVTSVSVKQPIPNLILSNSVRTATAGLTKSLALEYGQANIRFNSILPGWTETERVTQLLGARSKASGLSIEEEKQKMVKEFPMGRLAQPEEFANVAVFLSSPAASYINGSLIAVDGGTLKGTF